MACFWVWTAPPPPWFAPTIDHDLFFDGLQLLGMEEYHHRDRSVDRSFTPNTLSPLQLLYQEVCGLTVHLYAADSYTGCCRDAGPHLCHQPPLQLPSVSSPSHNHLTVAMFQKWAACIIVTRTHKFDQMTPVLWQYLHWLPVQQTITYKVAACPYRSGSPWSDSCLPAGTTVVPYCRPCMHQEMCALPTATPLLCQFLDRKLLGTAQFAYTLFLGPRNSLPQCVRNADSFAFI